MDSKTYQAGVSRTLAQRPNRKVSDKEFNILHAALGTVTEAAEIADIMKGVLIKGKELDKDHLIEEVGDVMYYLGVIANETGVSFEDIMEVNANKLKARYPNGFTAEKYDRDNRNLSAEQIAMVKSGRGQNG